jgi:hypothetical protein
MSPPATCSQRPTVGRPAYRFTAHDQTRSCTVSKSWLPLARGTRLIDCQAVGILMVQTAALLASSLWGGHAHARQPPRGSLARCTAGSSAALSIMLCFHRDGGGRRHHRCRRSGHEKSKPRVRRRVSSASAVRRGFFFLLGAAVVPTNLMARDQCMCFALVCSFCTRSDPREDDPDLTSDPRFHGREDHAWLCFSLFGIRRFDDCCTAETLITPGIDEIIFPAASVVHLSQSKAINRIST